MLYENITEVIGNTPLIKLHPFGERYLSTVLFEDYKY